jgi:PIN domain nuclease of toxin-antitoxin system
MNLLLDTPIALWAVADSAKIKGRARKLLAGSGVRAWS